LLYKRSIRFAAIVPTTIGVWLFITGMVFAATPPFHQCPAIGLSPSCAVLFTINPDGSITTSVDPGIGPYEGVEDTLVGVQNNTTSTTIPSLTLAGSSIFALDGDGICANPNPTSGLPGINCSGNAADTTGYGGPKSSFVIVDRNNGTVVFAGGLAPGGSTFFSLEEPPSVVGSIKVEQPIIATGTTFSAVEGTAFTGTVATAKDADTTATPSDYTATINWGDGTSSPGTISGSGGSFTISGSHTYVEEGKDNVTLTITDSDTPLNASTVTSTATVADAPLTSTCALRAVSPQSFSGAVASLTDANPKGTASDFTATIAWGDGTTTSGTLTGAGPFTVNGSHTYTSTGAFTVTTKMVDVGGSTTTSACPVLVFAFAPGGGSFAIGDKNAANGASVEFWGARWAKDNTLSGGSAPDSFKGFAESPLTPACGSNWTADPGNSTPPPSGGLPAYMAVIVTSSAARSGSTDSGNIVHIVVVKTNGDYQPDPGHSGTGTVVASVC
jgi:hypothetical protein